ncbi:M15 family metallopeptidase [Chromobacterium sphagni]|uniref:M15 family metallopeptidase n=1 Tax=Chromobacterium sphagni TaxID=1903179 RepID=UPI001F4D8601|nr:M15 family metallopeptidase [Chromobacterium sphagni]
MTSLQIKSSISRNLLVHQSFVSKIPMTLIVPLVVACIVLLLFWLGWRYFLGGARLQVEQAPIAIPSNPTFVPVEDIRSDAAPSRLPGAASAARGWLQNRWLLWMVPLLSLSLVGGVVAITLHFGGYHQDSKFIPNEYAHGNQIRQALLEEKLVPPPPLPPEAFIDAVAEKPSLALDKADRDWSKMDPAFVQDVLRVMEKMKARGFPMVLLEGFRSAERQNRLAGGSVKVTQAKGGESKHQYGLAADLAPVRNGKVVISERDPWAMQAYTALGEESKAAGLGWGGVWSFRDYGHVERAGSLRALLAHKNK